MRQGCERFGQPIRRALCGTANIETQPTGQSTYNSSAPCHTAGSTLPLVSSMPTSAGTRLPSELLQAILLLLSVEDFDVDFRPASCWRTVEHGLKRGLTACSLTCRHWAIIVRPTLFGTLILRRAEDYEQLLSFLRSPTSIGEPLPHLIRQIGIQLDGSRIRPWVHHLHVVASILQPQEQNHIKGPLFDIQYSITPILLATKATHLLPFQSSPRTLPNAYPPLGKLHLEGQRLRRSDELVRFLHAFPSLDDCILRHISFSELAPLRLMPPPLRKRQDGQRRPDAKVWGCGDESASTQLALAAAAFCSLQFAGIDGRSLDLALQAVESYCPRNHSSVRMTMKSTGVFYHPRCAKSS